MKILEGLVENWNNPIRMEGTIQAIPYYSLIKIAKTRIFFIHVFFNTNILKNVLYCTFYLFAILLQNMNYLNRTVYLT